MKQDWISKTWISFIWTQSFPNQPRQPAPFSALARPGEYKRRFEGLRRALRDRRPPHSGLGLPWKKASNRHFWGLYSGGLLESEDRDWPWERCVPLRLGLTKQVAHSALPDGTISAEAYLYAHGVSLVVTLYLYEQVSLLQRVREAVDLYRSALFAIDLDRNLQKGLKLEDLAANLLDHLRQQMGASDARRQAEPFSLVSVLRGAPDFAQRTVPVDEDIQRALQALSTWSRSWEMEALDSLVQHRVKTSSKKPGQLLYASQRGRVLWSPQDFCADNCWGFSTLRAYHRNLLMASMQTESLAMHLNQELDRLDTGQQNHLTDYTKETARLLRGLYYGCYNLRQRREDIYRTWSVRAQIEQNHYLPNINRVLQYIGGEQLIPEVRWSER